MVTLYGEARRDLFGIKTHVADLVGDGRADLLVGAFYADAPERANAGKLYIFRPNSLLGCELQRGAWIWRNNLGRRG